MKKKQNVGMILILVLLCLTNACLDYSAVCKYFQVDMFTDAAGIKLENFLAFIISAGCALTLLVLPRSAAQALARGSKGVFAACMAGGVAIAVALSALRATADASSTTMSIDGTVSSSMTTSDVIFVVVMFVMSVGELVSSYFIKMDAIREERARLKALIERLNFQVSQIGERISAVDRIALEKKQQALAAAKSAGEALYLDLLENAGEYQNAFIGYAGAIESSRKEFTRAIDALNVGEGASGAAGAPGSQGAGAAGAPASAPAPAPAINECQTSSNPIANAA